MEGTLVVAETTFARCGFGWNISLLCGKSQLFPKVVSFANIGKIVGGGKFEQSFLLEFKHSIKLKFSMPGSILPLASFAFLFLIRML